MYMPVELFPLMKTLVSGHGGGNDKEDIEPLQPGKPVARQVEAVGREPPSPKSLGDDLEESKPSAMAEQGEGSFVGDVPETQVELGETQLEETQMAGQDGMDFEAAATINIDQVATEPLSNHYISKALDDARHDEEDADVEEDEIILIEVPPKTSLLETGSLP